MKHVVSISSGVPSAVAAKRVIDCYGSGNTVLVFADTGWEDDDNYRFLADVEAWLNMPIVRLQDGRTPLEVFQQRGLIPNQMHAPCTSTLKLEVIRRYLKTMRTETDITLHIGMDWKDRQKGRLDRPVQSWGELGIAVEYPLLWEPLELDAQATIRRAGIQPPRMYSMGYSHANCGGRCVKQGKQDWRRTLAHFPERFAEVEAWETAMRQRPQNADYALLRDERGGEMRAMALAELRAETEAADDRQLRLFAMVDEMQTVCGVECGIGYAETSSD